MELIRTYNIILLIISTFRSSGSMSFSARKLLTDWCSLKCDYYDGLEPRPNIACGKCEFQPPSCVAEEVDIKQLLDMHNKLRDIFASGADKTAPGIKVANMHAVSWDNDLAYTARCNLAQCIGMVHDKCRATPKFPDNAGQNLFVGHAEDRSCRSSYTTTAVQMWYDEIQTLNPEAIRAMTTSFSFVPEVGHFTEVVWATVTHIGCAWSKQGDKCYLACNYGPGGNLLGGSMFTEGEPCSKCPDGLECGSTYKNLCGSVSTATHSAPNCGLIIIFVLLAYQNS